MSGVTDGVKDPAQDTAKDTAQDRAKDTANDRTGHGPADGVRVRAATVADIPELVRLREILGERMSADPGGYPAHDGWQEAYARSLRERLGDRDVAILVIDRPDGDGLAACGMGFIYERFPGPVLPDGRFGYVLGMTTDPAYRRRRVRPGDPGGAARLVPGQRRAPGRPARHRRRRAALPRVRLHRPLPGAHVDRSDTVITRTRSSANRTLSSSPGETSAASRTTSPVGRCTIA